MASMEPVTTKTQAFCEWYYRILVAAVWVAAAVILGQIVRETIADPGPILIPAAGLAAIVLRLTVAWQLMSRRP